MWEHETRPKKVVKKENRKEQWDRKGPFSKALASSNDDEFLVALILESMTTMEHTLDYLGFKDRGVDDIFRI